MRIDIDHLTLPEPEAVSLLKADVRRLRAAIAALADQDATLSVQGGNVVATGGSPMATESKVEEQTESASGSCDCSAMTVKGCFLAEDNSEPTQLWVWRGKPGDETAEPWQRVTGLE